jgi:hypothetical protein
MQQAGEGRKEGRKERTKGRKEWIGLGGRKKEVGELPMCSG